MKNMILKSIMVLIGSILIIYGIGFVTTTCVTVVSGGEVVGQSCETSFVAQLTSWTMIVFGVGLFLMALRTNIGGVWRRLTA